MICGEAETKLKTLEADGEFRHAFFITAIALASDVPTILAANCLRDGKTEAGAFFGLVGLIEAVENFF